MNQAITDTNVVSNLAVNPSLWLLASNMVLLKNPIIHNDCLKIASSDMQFGLNNIICNV